MVSRRSVATPRITALNEKLTSFARSQPRADRNIGQGIFRILNEAAANEIVEYKIAVGNQPNVGGKTFYGKK